MLAGSPANDSEELLTVRWIDRNGAVSCVSQYTIHVRDYGDS